MLGSASAYDRLAAAAQRLWQQLADWYRDGSAEYPHALWYRLARRAGDTELRRMLVEQRLRLRMLGRHARAMGRAAAADKEALAIQLLQVGQPDEQGTQVEPTAAQRMVLETEGRIVPMLSYHRPRKPTGIPLDPTLGS